jgi:biopolymer transport protein ExbB
MEVPRIEKNLRGLYTVALIAPLIGMLGTVNGLIETFVKMSNSSGLSSNLDMAEGIYQALVTTGLGLLVAIPAYLFYLYFVGRTKRLVHRIERGAIEIVNIICDERDAPKLEHAELSEKVDVKKTTTNKTSKNTKK